MPVKPLTPQEYDKRIELPKGALKTLDTSKKSEVLKANTIDQDVFVQTSFEGSPDYFRHTLPSRGFFYLEKKDLLFRPLKVKDLKKIQHFLSTTNITHLIDAVQNCIESDVDVRDLTTDDFFFVAFQIVFSSHQKPEYRFKWTSFYANENEEVITPNDLEIQELDVKSLSDELPDYRNLGFIPFSVRAYETLHNNRYKEGDSSTWDLEKTSLYEDVACYLNESSPEEQLARAENMDVKSTEFTRLKRFKQLIQHNIKTELKRSDKFFDAEKALEALTKRIEDLQLLDVDNYADLAAMSESMRIESIQEEIDRIKAEQAQSQEVRAKVETIPFRPNFAHFVGDLLI